MMDSKIYNLISDAIDNEYEEVQVSRESEAMNNNKAWLESNDKYIEILNDLKEIAPDDVKQKLSELDEKNCEASSYITRYYFNEGMKFGLKAFSSALKIMKNLETV